jgi:hypothetical protein
MSELDDDGLFDGLVESNYVYHDGEIHQPGSKLDPSILKSRPIFIHPSVLKAIEGDGLTLED